MGEDSWVEDCFRSGAGGGRFGEEVELCGCPFLAAWMVQKICFLSLSVMFTR